MIALLYEGLVRITPGIGARVAHAAALAEARDAHAGLVALDRIAPTTVVTYQPYWTLRAHLSRRLRRADDAAGAST